MPDEGFFVRHRGQVSGPFTREQLLARARTGQITAMHSISTDQANWTMAKSYGWIFAPPPEKTGGPRGHELAEDPEPTDGGHGPEPQASQPLETSGQPISAPTSPIPRSGLPMVYAPEFRASPYKHVRPALGIWILLSSLAPLALGVGFSYYAVGRRLLGGPGEGTAGELIFWFCLALFLGAILLGAIEHFIHMYRAWKHIIHWNRTHGMLTSVSSPDGAVGMFFVPVFGQYYWCFKLYGIGDDVNQLIDRGLVQRPRVPAWMSVVMCISLFLAPLVINVIFTILHVNDLPREANAVFAIFNFLALLVGMIFLIIFLTKVGAAIDELGSQLGGVE